MQEYQIQLRPGKEPHFKTAVRAFDNAAKIASINNSSINFSLHTTMDQVDIKALTSVQKATLIVKKEITENPCKEIELPSNGEVNFNSPAGSRPFCISANEPKTFFREIDPIVRIKKEIVESPSMLRREYLVSGDLSKEPTKPQLRYEIIDSKNNFAEAIAFKSRRFENNIAATTDRKEKLRLLEQYSNFLKFVDMFSE